MSHENFSYNGFVDFALDIYGIPNIIFILGSMLEAISFTQDWTYPELVLFRCDFYLFPFDELRVDEFFTEIVVNNSLGDFTFYFQYDELDHVFYYTDDVGFSDE